jgi:hypothetical protein
VPVVLNMISSNETAEATAAIFAAVKPRPRYGLGASARIEVTAPASARVAVATRPCTDAAVPAAHVVLAGFGLGVTQLIGEQSEFMTLTRTSASGGGAVGPHTAREPV